MTARLFMLAALVALTKVTSAKVDAGSMSGFNRAPDTQYHIQTDEGQERYFKYQTISGQYRKEKRLQDGTVVGTYGWVDPNGYLRLRDYVADNTGYRVVRTKMLYVGKDEPIGNAISKSRNVPSQGGTLTTPSPPTASPSSVSSPYLNPISSFPYPQPEIPSNSILSTVAPQYSNGYNNYILSGRPSEYSANRRVYEVPNYERNYAALPSNVQNYQPLYDGISATHNGFRYYLPRHYHEEEGSGGDRRSGSFGYIDPFGIRRVIYYNTAPGTGFIHRKNNRYVGFNATPYDPRY